MKSIYLIFFAMAIFGSLQNCQGCENGKGDGCDGANGGGKAAIPFVTGCECDTEAIVKHHDGSISGNCFTQIQGKFFCYVNKESCGEANTGRFRNKWINYKLCDCGKYPNSSACQGTRSKFGMK